MLMMTIIQTMEQDAHAERTQTEQLLLAVAAGDRDALATLYQRTRAAVYAMSLSLLHNAHDAQDITQDTFVRIWEKADSYRPHGSPMAWILTIARNLARMKLRQGNRIDDLSEEEWEAIPADMSDIAPEEKYLLQTALAALSDQERQIVMLHAISGLKHREIAALMELPLPTVLSKYHRALKKLRVQMEGDDTQ